MQKTFSLFCSRDIVDLEMLQSDLPRTFWHISQKSKFPKIFASIQQLI